jgi:hypothetical protein
MASNVDESVWKGPVLRQQRRDGTWQPLGLEVFKDEFKCYKNEVCMGTFTSIIFKHCVVKKSFYFVFLPTSKWKYICELTERIMLADLET